MKLRHLVCGAIIVALLSIVLVSGQDAAAEEKKEINNNQEQEQLLPVSEKPIKLVHVLNPGEREYLSPNLIGVQNIAMTFLPLSMTFVNVIDAYREIVNGVRYEILLNANDTKAKDVEIVCRLVILEKPWLRTEWGDKVRELVTSNCTDTSDNLTDPAERSSVLNDKYPKNAFYNGGTRNEIGDDEMARLEMQIMPYSSDEQKKRSAKSTTTTSTTTTTTTTTPPPSTTATTTTIVITPTAATTTSTTTTAAKADIESPSAPAAVADDGSSTDAATTAAAAADDDDGNNEATTLPSPLSADEMKWLDDIFSVGALNFENSRNQNQLNQNEASAPSNDNHDADDASNDVQQSSEATSSSTTLNEQSSNLDEQQQQANVLLRAKRGSNNLVGGTSDIDTKDAEERLQASLDKLAAGDGPVYSISKIYSATTQVVSGSLTKIDADLENDNGEKERCQVEIWSQPWLPNGIEVTFDCPNKEKVKRRHSRSVEHVEKKTHKKHAREGLDKVEHLFTKFQQKFNRQYSNEQEWQMRLRIFRQNLRIIEQLNQNEMGSAKYGITEFADLTSTEYKERTGLWQREAESKHPLAEIPNIELPKEFDWREKGVISKVKNQGSCGSCWAFSVTGNIEGLHAVKTGKLEEYSEQELLDCDTIDSACQGGLPDNAYQAIEKIGGLELESEYPYKGRKQQCHFDKDMAHVRVTGAVDLPKNETAIAQWLIANGPISIGINANAMQFYRGGVSHPWHVLCSRKNLDHGVLIVGYGVSEYPMFNKTLPYWIIKNSWGPKWGEQGYYRVYRGDNTCGVGEMATSAVLA